jgi:hypothetical protein
VSPNSGKSSSKILWRWSNNKASAKGGVGASVNANEGAALAPGRVKAAWKYLINAWQAPCCPSNYDEVKTINGHVKPPEVIDGITTEYYLF